MGRNHRRLCSAVHWWRPDSLRTDTGRSANADAGVAVNDTASSAAYFKRLADAGTTWTQHRPTNEQELKKLLADIINDCEILINAEHEALGEDERSWFRVKCKLCKGKQEAALANLDAGSATFQKTLDETEQVMNKLVTVLRAGPIA